MAEIARLEAPWYSYRNKLNALFEADPDIEVGEVYESSIEGIPYAIDVQVKSHEKFTALERVLPYEEHFGNTALRIFLFDEENKLGSGNVDVFRTIFDGNPIVQDVREFQDPAGYIHSYVRFRPEVIQFFDDDLTDYNGNWSGLAQDIAREIFGDAASGVNFCTADIRENGAETPMGVPLT